MTHVLDTDTLSLYRSGPPTLIARIKVGVLAGDVGITVISVEEQIAGWYDKLRKAKTAADLSRAYARIAETVVLLGAFDILVFSEPAIERYKTLRAMKLNIGAMDLRIAAIALEHGCTVVTRNLRDFGRVPELVVEDWSA